MPSPADRRRAERALQGAALVALALLAWRPPPAGPGRPVHVRDLPAALAVATVAAPRSLDVVVDSFPGVIEREWLRAVREAGTPVTWRGSDSARAPFLVVEPGGSPSGDAIVTWRTPRGSTLRDVAGTILEVGVDTVATARLAGNDYRLEGRGGTARGDLPANPRPTRRVRVLGRAEWETRFVALALEEAGWTVEVDLGVTDTPASVGVRTRDVGRAIDTATHAAVALLGDVRAARASGIEEFVRDGGGLILAGDAAGALARLSPGTPAGPLAGRVGAMAGATPRDALNGTHLRPRDDAVAVEFRGDAPVVLARREGRGRVVAVGFADTWRWRMEGPEGSVAAHREWWSALVAAVSRAEPVPPSPLADPAPGLAWQVAAGAPGTLPPPIRRGPGDATLLTIILTCLTGAWVLRRLRGAP